MVQQTPILRDNEQAKEEYRSFACVQMNILKDYMQKSGLTSYSREVRLANGVVVTCVKSFNSESMYVHVPSRQKYTEEIKQEFMFSVFIGTPRVFGKNDGYEKTAAGRTETGYGLLDYPLLDNDKTAVIIGCGPYTTEYAKLLSAENVSVWRKEQLYGNVDWVGSNAAGDDALSNAKVLTWKGPTGRSLPFDFSKEITGLTTADIKFTEDSADYFTCFGPNIYQEGEILATLPTAGDIPPKVLGAALTTYTKDGVEAEVLICVVNNHYADKLGFSDEVWVEYSDGWKMIHSMAAGRPDQCWFFSQSGNKCTKGQQELVINVAEETVELVTYDSGSGTYSAKRIGEEKKEFRHNGTYHLYSDYQGDTRVSVPIQVDSLLTHEISGGDTRTTTDVGVFGVIPDGTQPLAIIGPDAWGGRAAYTVTGGYCACAPEGSSSMMEWPDEATDCGMFTLRYTDQCGAVAELSVRMPSGKWLAGTAQTATCSFVDPFGVYPSCDSFPDPCPEWYSGISPGCWNQAGTPSTDPGSTWMLCGFEETTITGGTKVVKIYGVMTNGAISSLGNKNCVYAGNMGVRTMTVSTWVCP